MHFQAWLHELTNRFRLTPTRRDRGANAPRKRRPATLHLESLEDRTLLSTSPVTVMELSTSAVFSTSSSTYVAVPGLSGTITVAANQPVDASARLNLVNPSTTALGRVQVALAVDGTVVQQQEVTLLPSSKGTNSTVVPLHWALTNLTAGNHTITVEIRSEGGTPIKLDTKGSSSLTALEYNAYASGGYPESVVQASTTTAYLTSSTLYSAIPGLKATVTVPTNAAGQPSGQTVNASAVVDLTTTGLNKVDTNVVAEVALAVDGTVVQQQEVDIPVSTLGATNTAVPLNWTLTNLSAGSHVISVELRLESGAGISTDSNGTSTLTLTQYKSPSGAPVVSPVKIIQATPSSAFSTTSTTYKVIPGLSSSVTMLASEVLDVNAVIDTASSAPFFVALQVDGNIVQQEEVTPPTGVSGTNAQSIDLHWNLPNLLPGPHTVQVLIRSENGLAVTLNTHGNSALTITRFKVLPTPDAT